MTVRRKDIGTQTIALARDLQDICDNGIVQITSRADLDDPAMEQANLAYSIADYGLWRRVSAGIGQQHWGGPFQGFVPLESQRPVLAHSAYGVWSISNFEAGLYYDAVASAGVAVIVGSTVNSDNPNAIIEVFARTSPAGQSLSRRVERKAYTYHSENHRYPCGSHQCNCRTDWGACGCGTCAGYPSPNGQSWGQCGCPGDMCWYNQQTVCDSCTSYCDNWVQVKDATPAGYTDSHGEWVRAL